MAEKRNAGLAVRAGVRAGKLDLYGTAWDPGTKHLKPWMDGQGFQYSYHDVDEEPEAAHALGIVEVPTLIGCDTQVRGVSNIRSWLHTNGAQCQ